MNPRIIISGAGAVSPAGWGLGPFADALAARTPLPTDIISREDAGVRVATRVRRVPPPPATIPKSARLRRASAISRFAAAAAAEALGEERLARAAAGELRVGVVCTLMNGCVSYSNRFFGEVLADPTVASPILFPETVFNAPSSHISAMFGITSPNDTLIGDGAEFYSALELAAEWLTRGETDGCLVIGAEEADWLSAEGAAFYSRNYIMTEGAGALYLERGGAGIALSHIPDPVPLARATDRGAALQSLRGDLAITDDGRTLLVDGRCGVARYDSADRAVWHDWTGPRLSPLAAFGEGMGTSAAWQMVAAWQALQANAAARAVICTVGGSKQAAGAVIVRNDV